MTLPIAKPSITSYLHYAHDLSIAETDARAGEYLALNFLQLHTKVSNTRQVLVDFCAYGQDYPLCPFLSNELLTGEALRALGQSPVDKACAILDAGAYVRVDLNEYHVSAAKSYQQEGQDLKALARHLRPLHFNLIYGYSREERTFLTHGFNTQLNYTSREISFDEFDRAYYGDDVGMCRLKLTEADPAPVAQYDRDRVINYLTDFVESRQHSLKTGRIRAWDALTEYLRPRLYFLGLAPLGSVFGMATYDFAVSLVEKYNGAMIDIRPWCVFYDHKRLLLKLHDYLVEQNKIVLDKSTLRDLKLIEKDFLGLRNYLLDAQLNNRPVKIESLKSNMMRVSKAEKEVISTVIAAIRTGAATEDLMNAA